MVMLQKNIRQIVLKLLIIYIQNINYWWCLIWKNALLSPVKQKSNNNYGIIENIYLQIKDPNQARNQCLIKNMKKLVSKKDQKSIIEYSNNIQDVLKNIEEYESVRKLKILIIFEDMIADMISYKTLNQIVTELFIRGIKLDISLVFITQSHTTVPKDMKLNSTYFLL